MKIQRVFLGALIILALATCKKETGNSQNTYKKLATALNIQSQAIQLYDDTLQLTNDSIIALNAVGQWLIAQPEVEKAYYWSTQLIEIYYTNGLRSSISFISTDADGQHLSRGSSNGTVNLKQFGTSSKINIRNNKVLILNPFTSAFYRGNYTKLNLFDNAPQEMEVDIFNDEAVNYKQFYTFSDYGLIILNTHGLPWGVIVDKKSFLPGNWEGTIWTVEELADLFNSIGGTPYPLEKFESGEFEIYTYATQYIGRVTGFNICVCITEKFIRNADIDLNGAVVFNNSCYSGHTASGTNSNNMPEAFKSKGVASYYGYAFANQVGGIVDGQFAYDMEDSLIANLVHNGDTTAVAHLIDDVTPQYYGSATRSVEEVPVRVVRGELRFKAVPPPPPSVYDKLYFVQFFEPNYCYDKCGDTITDNRDGKKYATVCIGEQVWMAENLNWAGAGTCYLGNGSFCTTFGRLYTWAEMMNGASASSASPSGVRGICPEGWHIPSNAEWQELITFLGGSSNAGGKLKSTTTWNAPNTGATNESGFTALPAGRYDSGDGAYESLYLWSMMWSTTAGSASNYGMLELKESNANALLDETSGSDRLSCRCVKD